MQITHQRNPHPAAAYRHRVSKSTNLAVASNYARADIPVFPCNARKRPLTPRGHHDATIDLATMGLWWKRSPHALVGIPTGPGSGVWVLDVDGSVGKQSLNELMACIAVKAIAELTPCVSRTPSGGLHLIFRLQPGERPRNRARDIGAGLDTRGVKADGTSAGYFIAPGSTLPDGRRYEPVDAVTLDPIDPLPGHFGNAAPAPRKLVEIATFNAAQRAVIDASPKLRDAVRTGEPAEWPAILEHHRSAQRQALAVRQHWRDPDWGPGRDRQRRYLDSILARELPALAATHPGTGRNDAAFRLVCRVGRWAHHGVIGRDELIAEILEACERNGLVAEDGRKAVLTTITSGLARSAADDLPDLEARHG